MTTIYAAVPYKNFIDALAQKEVDVDSDTWKGMLLSAYTPSQSHKYKADVLAAGTEASGTGYTSGGATLSGVTFGLATGTRADSTAYSVGKVATPGNGYWYVVTTAGTTGSSAPTWGTTIGGTTTDGTVTWTLVGQGNDVWQFKGTLPDWDATAGSLSGKYVVFYDDTPGTNKPVACYWDLNNNTTVTATGDHFSLTQHAAGVFWLARI